MKYKMPFLLCSTALAVSIVAPAHAKPVSPVILSRYDVLAAAIRRLDLKTYSSFYAPNYVSVDPKGKVTKRAEYLAGVREMMKGATKASVNIKFKDAMTYKNGVVEVAFDATIKIQIPGGSKTFHEVGVDSWQKNMYGVWMEIKTVDKVMEMSAVL